MLLGNHLALLCVYNITQLSDFILIAHEFLCESLRLFFKEKSFLTDVIVLAEHIHDSLCDHLADLIVLLVDVLTGLAERFLPDPSQLNRVSFTQLCKAFFEVSLVLL